jgi:hypothetical protein
MVTSNNVPYHHCELVHYVQGAYDLAQQVGGNNVALEVQGGFG